MLVACNSTIVLARVMITHLLAQARVYTIFVEMKDMYFVTSHFSKARILQQNDECLTDEMLLCIYSIIMYKIRNHYHSDI